MTAKNNNNTGGKKEKRLHIKAPADLYDKLIKISRKTGKSYAYYVRAALREYFKNKKV